MLRNVLHLIGIAMFGDRRPPRDVPTVVRSIGQILNTKTERRSGILDTRSGFGSPTLSRPNLQAETFRESVRLFSWQARLDRSRSLPTLVVVLTRTIRI